MHTKVAEQKLESEWLFGIMTVPFAIKVEFDVTADDAKLILMSDVRLKWMIQSGDSLADLAHDHAQSFDVVMLAFEVSGS